jgi:activator of 2-hydroxyglutaryl-CoA dehydratase
MGRNRHRYSGGTRRGGHSRWEYPFHMRVGQPRHGRLRVDISEFDGLARQSSNPTDVASFCSVYAGTELLEKLRAGAKVPDIVRGIFVSVAKRVLAMAAFSKAPIVMTGGVVEHNPIIAELMKQLSGGDIKVPAHPQLMGALGAALYAQEGASGME